jgi:hypothetical protein
MKSIALLLVVHLSVLCPAEDNLAPRSLIGLNPEGGEYDRLLRAWNDEGSFKERVRLLEDRQGALRIDLSSVQSAPFKKLFAKIISLGIKKHVFFSGPGVIDLLQGNMPEKIGFYSSEDIDEDSLLDFMDHARRVLSIPCVYMGRLGTGESNNPRLDIHHMMIMFDDHSDDPILVDPRDGLEHLSNFTVDITHYGDPILFSYDLKDIVSCLITNNLHPSGNMRSIIDEYKRWIETNLSVYATESLTSFDKSILQALKVYEAWTELTAQGAYSESLLTHFHESLKEWHSIVRSSGDTIDFYDDFKLDAVDNLRTFLTRALLKRKESQPGFEVIRSSSRARSIPYTQKDVDYALLKDGDWVVTKELGLIQVASDRGRIEYRRVNHDDLNRIFAMYDVEAKEADSEYRPLNPQDGPFFRWERTMGRINYINDDAYQIVKDRAETIADLKKLALKFAFELLKRRIENNDISAEFYSALLIREIEADGPVDERLKIIEEHVSKENIDYRHPVVQSFIRFIHRSLAVNNEDLVRAGLLNVFYRSGDESSDSVQSLKSLPADVYFYAVTELSRDGVHALFDLAPDSGPLPLMHPEYIISAVNLFPRSHPFYPHDPFSTTYYTAKNDADSMRRMCEEYSCVIARRLDERGIQAEGVDFILTVPKMRGEINLLEQLTDAVSSRTGIERNENLVTKVKAKGKQKKTKSMVGKTQNVVGAYRVIDPEKVRGKRIMILDDHAGTGLTLLELQRLFLDAGAREVFLVALTGSPSKTRVEFEVSVHSSKNKVGKGIQIVQSELSPENVHEKIDAVIEEFRKRLELPNISINREAAADYIVNRFFKYNLIDSWANDYAQNLVNEELLRKRIGFVLEQYAARAILSRFPDQRERLQTNERQFNHKKINPKTAVKAIRESTEDIMLSDYDGTIAPPLTRVSKEVAGEILDKLMEGKKFVLVSQQNLEEIRVYFIDVLMEGMRERGIGVPVFLENLFIFAASGNTGYQVRMDKGTLAVQNLDDFDNPLLTPGEADEIQNRIMDGFLEYPTPFYIANRENAIFTLYYRSEIERMIAFEVLDNLFDGGSLPVEIIRNGKTRLRIVAKDLNKSRVRDYVIKRFDDVPYDKVLVLGDNFDPEDPLSDYGMIFPDIGSIESGVVRHREMIRELKEGDRLTDILKRRKMKTSDAIRSYEIELFVHLLKGNIYDSNDGGVMTLSEVLDRINPNSYLYFTDDHNAVFVANWMAAPDDRGAVPEESPLTEPEKAVLRWLEARTQGDFTQIVKTDVRTAGALGFETLGDLNAVLRKTFKMAPMDAHPNRFIGFHDTRPFEDKIEEPFPRSRPVSVSA